jgi:hypothetical protein
MITAGTLVIDKRTRRTGTVVRVSERPQAILYTRNSRAPRALVQWAGGKRSAMLLSALTVADEAAQAANRRAQQADQIERCRRELASCRYAIGCYEGRGEVHYAERARQQAARWREKLNEAEAAG